MYTGIYKGKLRTLGEETDTIEEHFKENLIVEEYEKVPE